MDLRKERSVPLKMLTCFLCEKAALIVKKFNEDRLEKCRKMLAYRKKKNLIYKNVVLPKSLMQRGYHLQCYDKFIGLTSNNRKEFASMFGDSKVLINSIPPLKIDSPNAFKKNTPSSSIEIPKLIEIPLINAKTCDIDLKVTPFKTYQMDEPSYVNPDISRGVILKSILTRKSPIKKDMTKDHYVFNTGMDLFRYGSIYNQPNLSFGEEQLGPKIVEMDSSANDVCIFCEKEQRKIGMQVELSETAKEDEFEKVFESAKAMEDNELLEKLKDNKIFSCHPLCRIEYRNQHQKITIKNCDEEDRLVIKDLKTKAFEALCAFIDEKIIEKNKTYFLTDLFERYKAFLCEIQNTTTPLDVESNTVLILQEEILTHYEGIIKITSKSKKKVVYKNGTADFDSAFIENEHFKYDKIAFELRSEIRSLKRKPAGITDGEIPEKLLRFMGCLIQGPARSSYENRVKIKSLCENIVARVNLDD